MFSYKEKVFLQNKTKLTIDQIQNWFTNSRKRLLKGAISKNNKIGIEKSDSEKSDSASSNKNHAVENRIVTKKVIKGKKENPYKIIPDEKITSMKKKQVIKKMLQNNKNASFYISSCDNSVSNSSDN